MSPALDATVVLALPLLAAAGLALLLEAAGAPTGARKKIPRHHHVVVLATAGVLGAMLAARAGGSGAAVGIHLSTAAAAVVVGPVVGEVMALLALGACGQLVLSDATTLPGLLAGLTLSGVCGAAVCALVPGQTHKAAVAGPHGAVEPASEAGTEAGVKALLVVGVGLALLALAAVLDVGSGAPAVFDRAASDTLGSSRRIAAVLTAIALVAAVGVAPVHALVLDVLHGAPAASVAVVPGMLLAVAGPLQRLAPVLPASVGAAMGALALGVLPLVALDQVRIGRIVGALALAPVGLVALALIVPGRGLVLPAAGAAAIGVVALLVGRLALPRSDAEATWEDWSGLGRRFPLRAGLFLFAASSAAGLPSTLGFDARVALAGALIGGHPWLAAATLASPALGAAVVVRLALFLFAKDARGGASAGNARLVVVLGAVVCASFAIGLAVALGFDGVHF